MTLFLGGSPVFDGGEMHFENYHITGCDMRNLEEFQQKLSKSGFDKSIPTVFLAECVLVYMTPESSSALVKWIADNVDATFFINYEQVRVGE